MTVSESGQCNASCHSPQLETYLTIGCKFPINTRLDEISQDRTRPAPWFVLVPGEGGRGCAGKRHWDVPVQGWPQLSAKSWFPRGHASHCQQWSWAPPATQATLHHTQYLWWDKARYSRGQMAAHVARHGICGSTLCYSWQFMEGSDEFLIHPWAKYAAPSPITSQAASFTTCPSSASSRASPGQAPAWQKSFPVTFTFEFFKRDENIFSSSPAGRSTVRAEWNVLIICSSLCWIVAT